MSTTKERLAELNALRAKAGMPELASWKSSREKLEASIAALAGAQAEEPEAQAEEPEAQAEEPEAPAEEPEAPAEEPEAPAEEPEAPAEEPEAQAEEPEAQAEEPEAQAEEPEAPAEKPERGAIGRLCMELLETDMSYADIVACVRGRYPAARTTARSLASVALDMRKAGVAVPGRRPQASPSEIVVSWSAVDGAHGHRTFRTLKRARTFAHERVGETPELGQTYAIAGDGVCRVTVEGATLRDLFPAV